MVTYSHRLKQKEKRLSLTEKPRRKYYSLYDKNLKENTLKSLFYLLCGTIYLLKENHLEKNIRSLQNKIKNWPHPID